ncbi:UNVERIFIED_CONTAM: hypothetical protein Sindi_1255700 [Sesamum indicum]
MAWLKSDDQCSQIFFQKVVAIDLPNVSSKLRAKGRHLWHLRPWIRRLLSDAESHDLTRPVTPHEVNMALFYIAEDKALGPDGYTSGFFKAASPIVGKRSPVQLWSSFAPANFSNK